MNLHQELPSLADQVTTALMGTVRSLKSIPLAHDETPELRDAAISRVAIREFAYLNALRQAVRKYTETQSEDDGNHAASLVVICNDHNTYLNALLGGLKEYQSFREFVKQHNNIQNAVYIGEIDVALEFISAIAPHFNRRVAPTQKAESLLNLIANLKLDVIADLITNENIPVADILLLKSLIVINSKDKKLAAKAVENRQMPGDFRKINWGYCRNALTGLYYDWKEQGNESNTNA